MKNIILLAVQGAGKGTLAKGLIEKYGYAHISTGDLLRERASKDDELGREIKNLIDNGIFAPNDIIFKAIEDKITSPDCSNGYILDGFPRTIAQAQALDEILKELNIKLDAVINIDVDFNVLVDRIIGRRVCPKCGASFHIVNQPPKKEGICDACGSVLVQRKDDTKETVVTRLDVYTNQTKPLLDYYTNQGLIKNVCGLGDIDVIFSNIKKSLGGC